MSIVELANQESSQGFVESFQSAYSHGFESIYALEDVNPKSIKVIHSKQPKIYPLHPVENREAEQLEFSFMENFSESMSPFFPEEPIEVLNLSPKIEKVLRLYGKKTVGDLLVLDLKEAVFFKGLGHGHIEEIESKLNRHVRGRSKEKAEYIDWEAFLNVCQDGKKIAEKSEEVCRAFLAPWIARRKGVAVDYEIVERLENMSEKKENCREALRVVKEKTNRQLWDPYLIEIEPGIFCLDRDTAKSYYLVLHTAQSYFLNRDQQYSLRSLCECVLKESAGKFIDIEEQFFEKVIKLSNYFRVRKGLNHQLIVKPAF